MEKVKELNNNKKNPHRHRQQYGDHQRERGVGEGRKGKEGITDDGERLDFGW